MTDESEKPEKMQRGEAMRPGIDYVVSSKEFEGVDMDFILESKLCAPYYDLHTTFERAIDIASDELRPALRVLSILANADLRPNYRINPFKPVWQMDGQRAIIPGDFCHEQFTEIKKYAPKVNHILMRARISDVVWEFDKSQVDMGAMAITAYCDFTQLIKEKNERSDEKHISFLDPHHVRFIQRAGFIARAMGWKNEEAKELKRIIHDLTKYSFEMRNVFAFQSMAEINMVHEVSKIEDVAQWAESLARNDNTEIFAAEGLWEIAIDAYRQAQDDEKREEATTELAKLYEYRARNSESSMVGALFLEKAIATLRHVKGKEEHREYLYKLLIKYQLKIDSEMGAIPFEFNFKKPIKNTLNQIGKMDLHDRLLYLFTDAIPKP